MHDLSDGMAIIGFNSQKRVIPNYSTTAVEVRTFDGTTKIGLASGTVTITATNTHITGALQVDGKITSADSVTAPTVTGSTNVIFGEKSGIAHTHSGVATGSGNTGVPN
jgi:phage baseplate assembly protein gpV